MKNMKNYFLLIVFFTCNLMAFGEFTEKEVKRLERDIDIAGVRDMKWKDDNRNKFQVLEVFVVQNKYSPEEYDMTQFRMQLIVEVEDKDDNIYLIRYTGKIPEDYYNVDYEGEDYWKLYISNGDLGKLDISAYSVKYGIMDGETFVPLTEDEDDAEELLEREEQGESKLFPGKVFLSHYYMYKDSNGITESLPRKINPVKE